MVYSFVKTICLKRSNIVYLSVCFVFLSLLLIFLMSNELAQLIVLLVDGTTIKQLNFCFNTLLFSIIYQAKMPNNQWLQLLKCENYLFM